MEILTKVSEKPSSTLLEMRDWLILPVDSSVYDPKELGSEQRQEQGLCFDDGEWGISMQLAIEYKSRHFNTYFSNDLDPSKA